MSDRLPNPGMCYMSQAQTLLRRADMRLHMYPSSPCGRCVSVCLSVCPRTCVSRQSEQEKPRKCPSQWRHGMMERAEQKAPGLDDEVGGCGMTWSNSHV